LENTLIEAIVQGMQAKKAEEINIFNLKHIGNAAADYFIICSGHATTQVEAIAEAIIGTAYQRTGEYPWQQEGLAAKEWVLIDYVNVIAHIFYNKTRAFYTLDTLWGDALIRCVTN